MSKIKICDALMGSGKTSACINMMNSTKKKKFMFVTEYLSEVERIKSACASKNFVDPQPMMSNSFSKLNDIGGLILDGRNIATTHALFLSFNEEVKKAIKDQHYVLVLDEVVDLLMPADISKQDLEILERSKTVTENADGTFQWNMDDYLDRDNASDFLRQDIPKRFAFEMKLAKSRAFFKFKDMCYFWIIPPELFSCFEEVYVLTYMFHGQTLRYFFDMCRFKYEYISVTKDKENGYQFIPYNAEGRKVDLRDKIHILEHPRLNRIGDDKGALSSTWITRALETKTAPKIKELRDNIFNVFHNLWKCKAYDNIWSTFKEAEYYAKGKGYTNNFVPFNKKASNEYGDRHYLAYCVNIYQRPWEVNYYASKGVHSDQNIYALSIMVQWIFRSAIRNGEDIWLYLPSDRMRTLLKVWLDALANGEDITTDYKKACAQYRDNRPVKDVWRMDRKKQLTNK